MRSQITFSKLQKLEALEKLLRFFRALQTSRWRTNQLSNVIWASESRGGGGGLDI